MHGKNICDVALSNLPSNAITEAIRSGDLIFSGSRNVVAASRASIYAETLTIVNHMVRLAGLRFSPGPCGPVNRQLRSAREALLSIILAYKRIPRSRRAAVETSLTELVWRWVSDLHAKLCVRESIWQSFLRLRRGRSPRG